MQLNGKGFDKISMLRRWILTLVNFVSKESPYRHSTGFKVKRVTDFTDIG